jgi:hypothetical protein
MATVGDSSTQLIDVTNVVYKELLQMIVINKKTMKILSIFFQVCN